MLNHSVNMQCSYLVGYIYIYRCQSFGMEFPLLQYLLYASSEGSGETGRMWRPIWALASCQFDKYQNLIRWHISYFWENWFLLTPRQETPKCVLWQTAKTQMKCSMMLHFIRVCTVYLDKIDLQREKILFFRIKLVTPQCNI